MDFCQLLHKAKKNEQNSSGGARYYSTKFEPPKKIKKDNKNLSANIKRFLAKKEAEEQQKQQHENKKKEELLALRAQDKKATRRVNVMLKRTKSANQSVLEEAVDNTHTAVTRAGPEQPDEDDYGYVSQEASALYEKMMQKYSEMPEEPKFNLLKKKVSTNLSGTKDRVKAALEKEREEAMQPRKRKRRKHQEGAEDNDKEPEEEKRDHHDRDSPVAKVPPKPKLRPAAPPPLSFAELLQIAAQKQHEPIVIEEKPQEEEKLYTKKQKKELEKEREWREQRERRQKEAILSKAGDLKILEKQLTKPLTPNKVPSTSSAKPSVNVAKKSEDKSTKPTSSALKTSHLSNSTGSGPPDRNAPPKNIKPNGVTQTKESLKKDGIKGKPKDFSPRDLMQKGKPKEFPPRDLKPKQFSPGDVRGLKRPRPLVTKGRILDDDDSEYDSELDDFIDDGPEEGDYSNYIKEIFGYDKSRYKDLEEDVDNMESSFAQQMKEEVISAKIGIKEDLEDMKKEEEEKRRKALMKKKMKR